MDYYIGSPTEGADFLTLNADEAHHCIRVSRHKAGDIIRITDGMGQLWEGEIMPHEKHPEYLNIKILSVILTEQKNEAPLILLISPPQHPDRLEWLIEKAVELGVTQIVLTGTARRALEKIKMERIQKILKAACKQSGRSRFPSVVVFESLESAAASVLSLCDIKVMGSQDGLPLKNTKGLDYQKATAIAIGPEGDFTEAEKKHLEAHGCIEVSLGKLRLRTETAAIAFLSFFSAFRT
jgi:16S rRNA (uracil1498-N3)-methyltransferase